MGVYQLVGRPKEQEILETLLNQYKNGGGDIQFTFNPPRWKEYSDTPSTALFYDPALNPQLPERLRREMYKAIFEARLNTGKIQDPTHPMSLEIMEYYDAVNKKLGNGAFPFALQTHRFPDEPMLRVVEADVSHVTLEGLLLYSSFLGAQKNKEFRDAIREAYGVRDVSSLHDGLPNPLGFSVPIFLKVKDGDEWWTVVTRRTGNVALAREKLGIVGGMSFESMTRLMDGARKEISEEMRLDAFYEEVSPFIGPSPFEGVRQALVYSTPLGRAYLIGVGGAYMGRNPLTLHPEFMFMTVGYVNQHSLRKTLSGEGEDGWYIFDKTSDVVVLTPPNVPKDSFNVEEHDALYLLPVGTAKKWLEERRDEFAEPHHDALLYGIKVLETILERTF